MINFLKGIAVVTIMALLYIHLQMNIYALAYQGKKRENRVEKLAEHNAMVKNDIMRLKSSSNIGRELLSKEKEYKFVSRNNVVEVESNGVVEVLASKVQEGQGFFGRVMTLAFSGH
jgi:hypothetical protein